MSTDTKLYIVRIPGPDDLYAAPSYQVAQLMKAHHDKWAAGWLAKMHANRRALGMQLDDALAVIEECDDPEEHAEMLTEFSFSEWGITEQDLATSDDSQARLFQENQS